ncbi:DNA recombination protein RmuC [Acholeplasma equirhinis]|uniref:DNA recombination protein RmuC n=1 Tax=Acholeplasma equirhinis TaxID=555393 RepID=UPI00197A775E|nr:DNA recombination protein RmuC [Acholeplasma equirhinis]MBN3491043.1 DNA recombination protein RmuC [Acholeplasma equirhinis]
METTLIILSAVLVLVLILMGVLIFLLVKKPKSTDDEARIRYQQELVTKIEHLRNEFAKELELVNAKSKGEIKDELDKFKDYLTHKVTTDVTSINEKVERRLTEGFKTTQELFNGIKERLTVIDTTQKNIEKLSTNVDELSGLLSDKKLRGLYGEAQLYNILNNVFGEGNKVLYEQQKKLSNGTMVDAIIYGPEGVGNIPIDSKFSLENYLLMNDDKASQDERNQAQKDFKTNIKKHIDDISSKYILKGETADQAIMFIPSESVFAEIHAKYPDLIEFAQKRLVWITSPTTLVYMLTMIIVIASNIDREKNAERMLKELEGLYKDFRLFFERWDEVKKAIDKMNKVADDLEKPMERLNKKVYQIEKSDFDQLKDESIIDKY